MNGTCQRLHQICMLCACTVIFETIHLVFNRMVRADSDDTPHLSRLGQSRKSLSNKSSTAGASSNSDNGFPAVRERVQMGIATSQSHSEVLQDMVLNLSSAEGKRDIEHEKKLLKDLVKEMVQFR